MRIIHTADWHLGQTLHGISRAHEHNRFLSWLEDTLARERADALTIIAGDVFDVANPPAEAQAAYFEFLARTRLRLPHLEVVVVGGNHDSADRLDAPKDVLAMEPLRIHVAGGLADDLSKAVIPLYNAQREIGAWLLAVPFLRRGDVLRNRSEQLLPMDDNAHERFVDAHRALYRELVSMAEAKRGDSAVPLIATGHLYMSGGEISELSERKIQVGNQHALPLDIFPDAIAYVALGHLHRAQSVLGKETVRYSGSPIPLSLTERLYEHQVLCIDFDGVLVADIRRLRVPRTLELLSFPEEHQPLQTVLATLNAFARQHSIERDPREWPLLEVKVRLDRAEPRIRQDIEQQLEGFGLRLVRIDARHTEVAGASLASVARLEDTAPLDVFRACWAKHREGPVPETMIEMFLNLVEEVERGEPLPESSELAS